MWVNITLARFQVPRHARTLTDASVRSSCRGSRKSPSFQEPNVIFSPSASMMFASTATRGEQVRNTTSIRAGEREQREHALALYRKPSRESRTWPRSSHVPFSIDGLAATPIAEFWEPDVETE